MKKFFLLVALLLPCFVFSQAPLKTKFETNYLEVSRSMIKLKTLVIVGSMDGISETLLDENGNNWAGSTIQLINFMDKNGYAFEAFMPIPAAMPMIDRILFRKKE